MIPPPLDDPALHDPAPPAAAPGPRESARSLRGMIVRMAQSSGCPKRTAAAFALGVFLSFSPFLGLQILIAVGMALTLRLSRPALFAGLCANMPWFMIPWYSLTTALGAFILRVPISADIGSRLRGLTEHAIYRATFWQQLGEIAGPFLGAFVVGTTIGAALAAVAAYFAVVRVLRPLHGA